MKLTKSIISPVLVATLLCCVGCTSSIDDFDPTEAPMTYISFDQPVVVLEGAQTRATLTGTAYLTEFKVCGFCVPQNVDKISNLDYSQAGASWVGKSKFCRPNVFGEDNTNNIVTVKKNGANWTYDNVKLWTSPFDKADDANKQFASSAKFTFIAWANGDFTLQEFSAEYAPKLEFKMPFSGGTQTRPVDCDHNAVKDALIAARYDHEKIEGRVPLYFKHILTALRFKVVNHSKDDLVIKSMALRGNFFGKATFTYETSVLDQDVDRTSNRYWGRFTIVNQNSAVTIPGGAASRIIGTSEEEPQGLNLLLLPDPDIDPTDPTESNSALGDSKYMDISYILNGKEYSTSIPIKLSYIPEQSTRHTATFNFLGKDQFYVVFKPEGEVWENGSDDTITIN